MAMRKREDGPEVFPNAAGALARLRDGRVKASAADIERALTGNWRGEHLFVLGQALAMFWSESARPVFAWSGRGRRDAGPIADGFRSRAAGQLLHCDNRTFVFLAAVPRVVDEAGNWPLVRTSIA